MKDRVILTTSVAVPLAELGGRRKGRSTLKGRQVDPEARENIATLLNAHFGDGPRRRDLLIEYLHLIQDKFGHLSAAHMAATRHRFAASRATNPKLHSPLAVFAARELMTSGALRPVRHRPISSVQPPIKLESARTPAGSGTLRR